MKYIRLINLASVGVFGMVLSASFCGGFRRRQKRLEAGAGMAVILGFQGICCFWTGLENIMLVYPLIMHLPLTFLLCALSGRLLWPIISVLTAYLCCQFRRWLALLAVTVFSGKTGMQDVVELAITLPLLLLLLRYISPSVRAISHFTIPIQCQFGLVPLLYYGFDYLTRVYTNMLLEGVLVAVEFMPFVCSGAYLAFIFHTAAAEQERNLLEQTQDNLNMQITQAIREIEVLRESQRKIGIYRHDLRHHMQYLSSCIENGLLEQARIYIREVCSEIESSQIRMFCENEVANLIFSSFAGRAGEYDVPITIRVGIPRMVSVSANDLCVLLSNALENALYACRKLNAKGLPGTIDIYAETKNNKLFLQFTNSCDGDVVFNQGVPTTDIPGHGAGVRSICAIVDKYGGICNFSVEDGKFILRVLL